MKYKLNKNQMNFIKNKDKITAFVSGLGGGKTFALQLGFIVNEVLKYPDAVHCMAALSYRQLQDVSIPNMEEFLDGMEIPWEWVAKDSAFIVNGRTTVLMRSQEVANKMRSVEIGSCYFEELAYWKKKAFLTFIGRLRDKNGSCRARAATTPNEKNWFYRYFILEKRGSVVYTSTYENKHLPADYVQLLLDSYDEMMIEQELKGSFIDLSGLKRYYSFEEKIHVKPQKLPAGGLVYVGMDFNVNPMTACYGYVEDDTIHVCSEVWLPNSNTYLMADRLDELVGTEGVHVCPDATGKARRSSATKSDHEILKEKGFEVERVRNPHRKDRFACVNGLLRHGKLEIDPSCTRLITDLNTCSGDTRDEDEAEQGHISDALGYWCWKLFPIKRSLGGGNYATGVR